ncbi:MAG: dihydroorotase [Pseudomonadota bacterium]|nr:dihydroorotase [Pseudomonadota bacterium]
MKRTLTLIKPDDWHLHLRDGDLLGGVLADSARQFGRAIVMPNLKPPVTTVQAAAAYRERILAALPAGSAFVPLMTLYLTESTTVEEIARARASGFVHAVKLYPAGATTHSDAGVRDLRSCDAVLAALAECGMPLLVHAEVTDPAVDIFDRERVFLQQVLLPALERHPALRVVVEHITTADAVRFVSQGEDRVAATLTAHHLLYNRNALFQGGFRPHYYCLPVLKRETHRQALVAAATRGSPRFFLGTDSAPHARQLKEHACGCAGIYTACNALELYAEAFAAADALQHLETFASLAGPSFYGLPPNSTRISLVEDTVAVPEQLERGGVALVPLRAGETVGWRLLD